MRKYIAKIILGIALLGMLAAGINPADYDPFFDNDHDTYHVLAAALPFTVPQQWTTPTPGPNAEACREVWDKGIPCPSDGKIYGHWGEIQPEYCDNNHFMPDGKTLKPEADKCTCNIAMTSDMKDCPMNEDGTPAQQIVNGKTCQVYCREATHCHCVNICDSFVPQPEAPKPAPKTKRK